ncbi:Splicing factor [Elasticomyces elasticus]|uniref:Splicing factor n=1 Tax=Exophiala sideris TaxID=1016849 RepID=A0ABR0JFU1_9EURO|nr:Splicing factor [Elasticomyces elasticus]KAK5025306.1 Splicing factor [Exophiala sideris]KAK5029147.1 Splicing factor [Exophiala sideris]KAK5063366.1 Splicing factor [Exophiala sideris]KAK5179081.1 Splicing factor [Eurotiomycetes sp. CCFEE 6388]
MSSGRILPQALSLLQARRCLGPSYLRQVSRLIPVPAGPMSGQFSRSSSAQNVDTLADLAPNQPHTRSTPPVLTSHDSSESQKSSAGLFPRITSSGATSNPRASFDIAMVETPKQVLRGDYTETSLPIDAQKRLSELVGYVQEAPSSFITHTEIISILHQGFVDHIYPSTSPNARGDPHTYELLKELRQARENFDKLYAVGENQWLDWLQDESILAQSADERVDVVNKCRRAVTEEFGSTRLWVTFGEWVSHCYRWALEAPSDAEGDNGDIERLERTVGREVFEWNLVLDTWAEAFESTKHDMAHSHEVWDKYMNVRFGDTSQKLSSSDATAAFELFQARLRVPHAEWQQTFQTFSSFVSANMPDQYENIMASSLKDSAGAKEIWNDRDAYESTLQEAQRRGDQTLEYSTFDQYIAFERNEEEKAKKPRTAKVRRNQKEPASAGFDMVASLYARAELRFPSTVQIWEAHLDYMVEKSKSDVLDLLARATKHCPWSGSLWKQYLLASELKAEDASDEAAKIKAFDETEKIKHQATSTGLLDAAGIHEALIVYDAWCGYLLRRTKRADAVEEDADVAEMGIRSSIEEVHSLASKQGLSPSFDTSFMLQRKYVEYLKSQRRFDNARAQFDDLIPDYGTYYKFWLRFYEFELQKSVSMAFIQQTGPERLGSLSSAPFAVGVLKQGLQYPGLDYPEPLIEALVNHCEDYEDADELQNVLIFVRKIQKDIAKKSVEAQQAEDIKEQSRKAEESVANRTQEVANSLHIGKRKREDESEEPDAKKRSKSSDEVENSIEGSAGVEDQLKRDREHASIHVHNLPSNVADTKLRQYFSSCGTVKHVKMLAEGDSAIVEFEEAEAATFALSRDGRDFEGSDIRVVLNTGSTLYVTNYPAVADETYIRDLMGKYGEIINVRFPSLQRNKRRRFCYVEFKEPVDAQAATELDNKEIEGLPLVVKISNPTARKPRAEDKDESRKIFVGHLPFKAKNDDIEKLFSQYGKLENIRVPPDAKNQSRNRGIAFLTYATSEQAQAALAMNEHEFMGRQITVQLNTEGSNNARKNVSGHSRSPSVQTDGGVDPRFKPQRDPAAIEDRKQRTVALSDVPDTVNESRIKAMAENIGPVRKVVLKTNHQGAIIEFDKVPDAGRAMIELDGHEIDPGRRIRVRTEKEMLQQKAEHKQETFVKRPAANRPTTVPAAGAVRRPMQPGARKGGNLGQRSAFLTQAKQQSDAVTNGTSTEGKKTNDDFRSLINKG